MLLNNYSVRIVGGNEVPGGYVELRHSQKYQIQLRNNNPTRCDAKVEVDGNHVGTWRLGEFSSANLERPVGDDGFFTFYRAGTHEAALANLKSGDNLGLIKVTFTPEENLTPLSYSVSCSSTYKGIDTMSYSGATRSAGGTGLSGHSNQSYGQASEMRLNYSGQTVIYLRLVCVDDDGPRPLTQYSTPVPPPVR